MKQAFPGGQYVVRWEDGSGRADATLPESELQPNRATLFRPAGTELPFQPYPGSGAVAVQ